MTLDSLSDEISYLRSRIDWLDEQLLSHLLIKNEEETKDAQEDEVENAEESDPATAPTDGDVDQNDDEE